jgi:hypothetical protein
VRVINRDEVGAGLKQVRHERNIAGESIELGNDQPRLVLLAGSLCGPELRAVAILAALDLREFGHKLPSAAVEVGHDGGALGVEAEA